MACSTEVRGTISSETHRRNEEGYPAHHDKHGGGEVHAEYEGTEEATQLYLESIHTVVA